MKKSQKLLRQVSAGSGGQLQQSQIVRKEKEMGDFLERQNSRKRKEMRSNGQRQIRRQKQRKRVSASHGGIHLGCPTRSQISWKMTELTSQTVLDYLLAS